MKNTYIDETVDDETVDTEGAYCSPASLPFPTKLVDSWGEIYEEYIIPEDEKGWVLQMLYPLKDLPNLDDEREDLHNHKTFKVREFKVVKWPLMLALMSPYWATSGGSVIDWAPVKKDK